MCAWWSRYERRACSRALWCNFIFMANRALALTEQACAAIKFRFIGDRPRRRGAPARADFDAGRARQAGAARPGGRTCGRAAEKDSGGIRPADCGRKDQAGQAAGGDCGRGKAVWVAAGVGVDKPCIDGKKSNPALRNSQKVTLVLPRSRLALKTGSPLFSRT